MAFLAEAGRGKSTLAAAFARNGSPFLTDDALVLDDEEGKFHAHPGHASVRLWQDSEAALIPKTAAKAANVHYSTKSRILGGQELAYCPGPERLLAAYFLAQSDQTQEISIRALTPLQALAPWMQHSYILDTEDKSKIGAHFDGMSRVVNAIPSFTLGYPRSYDALPRVMEAVRQHAQQASVPRNEPLIQIRRLPVRRLAHRR